MPTKKTSRKQATTTIGRTFINLIVDESGSMASTIKETISGVNTYLDGIRKEKKTYVTVTLFNSRATILYALKLAKSAEPLTEKTYNPSGFTALYDAIGNCVKAMSKEVKKGDRVLTVIVTDGAENASLEFNLLQIRTLITELEAKGNYTFTFMAANLDTHKVATGLGINLGNTMSYASTSAGTQSAFNMMSGATRAYAASADSMTKSFYAPEPTDPPVKMVSLKPKRRVIP